MGCSYLRLSSGICSTLHISSHSDFTEYFTVFFMFYLAKRNSLSTSHKFFFYWYQEPWISISVRINALDKCLIVVISFGAFTLSQAKSFRIKIITFKKKPFDKVTKMWIKRVTNDTGYHRFYSPKLICYFASLLYLVILMTIMIFALKVRWPDRQLGHIVSL